MSLLHRPSTMSVGASRNVGTYSRLKNVNSRWNRSLAVTQLPNELLFHIFVCFSEIPEPPSMPKPPSGDERDEDEEDGKSFPEFGLATAGWTKLMLVCRRWCDVARATPALWRTIAVRKTSNWMKLALTRSGNATVDISFGFNFSEEYASLLKPHCDRLRSLRLRTWSSYAFRVIRNAFPALEALQIHRNEPPRGFYTDLVITRKRFPNLRNLRLVNALIPKDPLFYVPLRKLSLKQCPFKASFEHFAQLLSTCQCLEDLELDKFLQNLSDNGNVGPPRSLPSLLSLRLNNHVPIDSARFLSHLVIPQTASLSIEACIEFAEEGDTLRAIVPPNFATSLPGLTNVTRGRLVVVGDEMAVNFDSCASSQLGREEVLPICLSLTSSFADVSWEYRMPDGLADLCALLGSAPLAHLEVDGNVSTVEAETWTRLFRAFPSLVSLKAGVAARALFDGLRQASVAAPAGRRNPSESDGFRRHAPHSADILPAGEPVACQGLELITISCYFLGWEMLEDALDSLIRCLQYRVERGARLQEFQWHIELCDNRHRDVVRTYLPRVENLVPTVRVGNIFALAPSGDDETLDEECEESEDGSDGSDDEE